jgi:hypothetical protein
VKILGRRVVVSGMGRKEVGFLETNSKQERK